jgi:hypothetical protein
MSAVNSRSHALSASPALVDATPLFKEDRPRRIDRVISFFGDSRSEDDDVCGEQLLDSFSSEQWSER